jgi:hypothetical protein
VADAVVLERAGVPAVSICTDAFVVSARAMAGCRSGSPGGGAGVNASSSAASVAVDAVDAVPTW